MAIHQNITKFYINRTIASLFFAAPIFVLFLFAKGFTMFEVMLLEAIYSIAIIALQFPVGAIADIIGRKKTVVFGYFIEAVALTVFTFGKSFPLFAAAQFAWGLGTAMILAQENSLVYDSLKAIKRQKESKRIFAYSITFAFIANLIGSVVGGYLAFTVNYESTFIATAGAFLCLGFLSTTFEEPEVYRKIRLTLKSYKMQMKESIGYVFQKREVFLLILASSLFTAMATVRYWFTQPYLMTSGVEVGAFGIIYGVSSLIGAIGAATASKFHISAKKLILLSNLSVAVAFAITAITFDPFLSPIIFLIPVAIWGICAPTYLDFIHKNVPSPKRATISSLEVLLSSFFFVVLAPILGYISDVSSLMMVFIILSILSILTVVFFFLQKIKLKE